MPYEDSHPPASKVRELIAYCESKKLPLIIGCDSNAHHTFGGSYSYSQLLHNITGRVSNIEIKFVF
jgi:hypothetical protein